MATVTISALTRFRRGIAFQSLAAVADVFLDLYAQEPLGGHLQVVSLPTPMFHPCAFDRLQIRMGQAEMNRRGETISVEAISEFIPTLNPTHVRRGKVLQKTQAELKAEAKRKLRNQRATQLVPRYSLYALRHAWATRALQSGLDALTVAVLMGHADPSTLARVYQHLSHDPEYLRKQAQKAAG